MKNLSILKLIAILFIALPSISFAKPVASSNTAIFAGGCFWCMQADFDNAPGVLKTYVGYTGGNLKNPTYKQVSTGKTGHYEAIEVFYNPSITSYKKLLTVFWLNIDPTNTSGQFCDKGSSYRAAIFYSNKNQKNMANASKESLIKSGRFKRVATKVLPAKRFYLAEQYHQKYYKKNPLRYYYYRKTCGRDALLKNLWGLQQ